MTQKPWAFLTGTGGTLPQGAEPPAEMAQRASFARAGEGAFGGKGSFSFATLAACLWMGAFPLLHLGTYTSLTRDKWIFFFLLLFLTVLCLLGDGVRHRLHSPAKAPLLMAGGLGLWMLVSCLASDLGPDSWWIGASARREGLLTQGAYLTLFFCFACASVDPQPLLWSAAAGVVGFATVVFLQRSGGNPFGLYPTGTSFATHPEFQGPTGNTDMGAGYLCLLSGLFLSALGRMARACRRRPFLRARLPWGLALCCLGGLALSVYLLLTMEVQFALIALGAAGLLALLGLLPRRVRVLVVVLLVVAGLLLVWYWPGNTGPLWELREILQGRPQLSFGHNRLAVWQYSLGLAKERLWLGGGSDTFEPRFNAWLQEPQFKIPTEQQGIPLPDYFDNPHNEYLAHLVNHGLPAALLFLGLVLYALFSPRGRHSPYRIAVVAYAVQAFFSFSVCILAPLFWVTLGLCCSEAKK